MLISKMRVSKSGTAESLETIVGFCSGSSPEDPCKTCSFLLNSKSFASHLQNLEGYCFGYEQVNRKRLLNMDCFAGPRTSESSLLSSCPQLNISSNMLKCWV